MSLEIRFARQGWTLLRDFGWLLVIALVLGCSSAASRERDSGSLETGASPDATELADSALAADRGLASKLDSDPAWGALLDACFAGLPAPVGLQTIIDLSSEDASTRVRMALDTMGKTGLSYEWTLLRLGLVVDGTAVCITEKSDLSYVVTHHNCNDSAAGVAGTTRYELLSRGGTSTELRLFSGATLQRSIVLTADSCTRSDGLAGCPAVGPC